MPLVLNLECDVIHFDKFINSLISNRALLPKCDMKVSTVAETDIESWYLS